MNNEQLPEEHKKAEEEEVVSVWYGSGNTKFFRRRYFDGYTFYETINEKGKRVTHNVYAGIWYTQELSREQRIRNRIAYILLSLVGAALVLLGSTRVIPINSKAYGAAPAFAGLFGFGWMMVSIFNEFTVPQKRTIGEYRASSLGLKRSGLMTAISCGVAFLITVIFGLIDKTEPGLHILAAGSELVAGVAGFFVRFIESKVVYSQKRSEDAGKYTM